MKLSRSENKRVLEEMWGFLVHPQDRLAYVANARVANTVFATLVSDTAPWLQRTLPIGNASPVVCRHDIRVPLNPSCIQNGPVLKELLLYVVSW